MYLRLFCFLSSSFIQSCSCWNKNWIAVYCAIGWVADKNATNALRFLLRVFRSWIISGFCSRPQKFPGHCFLGPSSLTILLFSKQRRIWGRGAIASFLRDSTPCRPKGCLLFTILKNPFWWRNLKFSKSALSAKIY